MFISAKEQESSNLNIKLRGAIQEKEEAVRSKVNNWEMFFSFNPISLKLEILEMQGALYPTFLGLATCV